MPHSKLISRLHNRYVMQGDELDRDAIACIREMEKALNALVAIVDPSEKRHRPALRNAQAVLRKLERE